MQTGNFGSRIPTARHRLMILVQTSRRTIRCPLHLLHAILATGFVLQSVVLVAHLHLAATVFLHGCFSIVLIVTFISLPFRPGAYCGAGGVLSTIRRCGLQTPVWLLR